MSELNTYITVDDLQFFLTLLDSYIDMFEAHLAFVPSSIQYDKLKELKEQRARVARVIEAMAISFVSPNNEKGKV